MSASITIGEVAQRAGVSTSAIRYYEGAGLLEEPERVGNKRRYDEEVLHRLALIGGAKHAGFTIGEIRILLHGFPEGASAAERWRVLASEKLAEVDEAIMRLRQARELLEKALHCKCASLENCAHKLHRT